jgi:hypothetical protein
MYTASCLCGAIQIDIQHEISEINICHCQQCQKAQGGAFAAVAVISKSDLQIKAGLKEIQSYYSSASKKRCFCQICASPLWSERDELPDVIRLRVGLINEPLNVQKLNHAFLDEKSLWLIDSFLNQKSI